MLSVCVCVCVVNENAELAEAVRTVLKQEISRLFGESNPQSFNKNYLSQHSNSIPHRLAGTHTHTLSLSIQEMSGVNVFCITSTESSK